MYGIGKDLDFSFLRNLEVIQVRIGVFQVQFAFMEDVCLSVEGSFRYSSHGEGTDWMPEATKAASAIVNLPGATVTGVEVPNPETLELHCSNGASLRVFDNSKEFESFTLTRPGETTVI
jgi:hypothetical protein